MFCSQIRSHMSRLARVKEAAIAGTTKRINSQSLSRQAQSSSAVLWRGMLVALSHSHSRADVGRSMSCVTRPTEAEKVSASPAASDECGKLSRQRIECERPLEGCMPLARGQSVGGMPSDSPARSRNH